MKLTGRTVLITGGGSGIGLALAAALLERGNRVAVCARREDKLEAARRRHPGLRAQRCDVTDAGDRQRLFESLARDGLAIDVLVNNAACMRAYDFTDADGLDMDALREDVAANFVAPLEMIRLFLPVLLRAPDPTIINVSSPGGVVPVIRFPVYCASKAALSSFTRSLRRQLRGKARVIALYPPSVETEMMEGVDLPKISVEACAREILRRLARDGDEVWIGEGRYIPILSRLAPGWIFEIVNRAAGRSTARA